MYFEIVTVSKNYVAQNTVSKSKHGRIRYIYQKGKLPKSYECILSSANKLTKMLANGSMKLKLLIYCSFYKHAWGMRRGIIGRLRILKWKSYFPQATWFQGKPSLVRTVINFRVDSEVSMNWDIPQLECMSDWTCSDITTPQVARVHQEDLDEDGKTVLNLILYEHDVGENWIRLPQDRY
jgi:hypothetical protein